MRRTSRSVMMVALALLALGLASSVVAQDEEVFVEIKKGTVVNVVARTLIVDVEGEGIKSVVVPSDFTFNLDGEEVGLEKIRPGMTLTSTRIRVSRCGRSA